MTIQDAVELCKAEKGLFARPITWKDSGEAVDIGCVLDGAMVRVVRPLGTSTNLQGYTWNIQPWEILADWEVISVQILLDELNLQKKD
jgi:hypothetical protein